VHYKRKIAEQQTTIAEQQTKLAELQMKLAALIADLNDEIEVDDRHSSECAGTKVSLVSLCNQMAKTGKRLN
jgi:hypothetical protein